MENRRFIALGDLVADFYYSEKKLVGIDGGSSRFNVIANLANMDCNCAVFGGCGNDNTGKSIVKRLTNIGVDTSKIFYRDRATRVYHLIYDKSNTSHITYKCSKSSPKNGKSTWYEDSLEDLPYYYSCMKDFDVVILDNLDEFSLSIINQCERDKVLDIGNTKKLKSMQDNQIFMLNNKLEILQLNDRVIPYLMKRFDCTNISEVYKIFMPRLMIITHGRDGADFIFENVLYSKKILESSKELDATGAGDAFLSVFVKKYYDNLKNVDFEFIDETFEDATALTSKVVQSVGARGHLYEKTLDKMVGNIQPEIR